MKDKKYTIEYIRENNLILFEAIVGSKAYGTDIETSDEDRMGIFIAEKDDVYGLNYCGQINNPSNDITFYEIRRFCELLKTNNPSVLTLLNIPDDCLIYKHPLFDLIINNRDKFLTKMCKDSFAGYAVEQIRKARGLNKKIANPVAKERKTPIDFCYVLEGYKSYPLRKWLEEQSLNQQFCGLVKIPNIENLYALFYDVTQKLGYRGMEIENSNDIRLSSIPKGEEQITHIQYNKNGYSSYCKEYKEYWTWVGERNPVRYSDNIKHSKNYDSKNMMHCYRLLDTAMDILSGKGLIIRRPNREELLKIRRGEYDYGELINNAEIKIKIMDELFDKSNLIDCVDEKTLNQLLVEIRTKFYGDAT